MPIIPVLLIYLVIISFMNHYIDMLSVIINSTLHGKRTSASPIMKPNSSVTIRAVPWHRLPQELPWLDGAKLNLHFR
jgi:hypothetical protein